MRAGPVLLLALLFAAAAAHAAKVYRCPDGSYADKPCGEGQRVVTTTTRYTVSPDADRQCVALAYAAEDITRGKAAGGTVQLALQQVDDSGLPHEKPPPPTSRPRKASPLVSPQSVSHSYRNCPTNRAAS